MPPHSGFFVGPVRVAPGLTLAPMSGVTDMAFRRLVRECSPGAVGLVVSEFISIEGLTRNDLRSHRMMRHGADEHPVAIQIFGADVDRMAEAAAMVQEAGVDVVDINCGCPVPKVVRRGGGAELLRRVATLEAILRAVRREVSIPVTLKIRVGWDEDSINAPEIARMAEAAGVALITVHGRTRMQGYTGLADWTRIAAVKEAVRIPVVGSGDVVDVDSAFERAARSRVDGLAIARGAMLNPWVFGQIVAAWRGVEIEGPTPRQRIAALHRFAVLLEELYPERVVAARLRGMACRVLKGFAGSSRLREAASRTRSAPELLAVLDAWEPGPESTGSNTNDVAAWPGRSARGGAEVLDAVPSTDVRG